MAEWSNALPWKGSMPQGIIGSNPILTAILNMRFSLIRYMNEDKKKLQESIRVSLAKQSVDFLVPVASALVNILTSQDIDSLKVKRELKKLKISDIRTKGSQIESNSIILDFKVYILYAGARNYILKIEGLNHCSGFSFMETNKGMIVHDNVVDNPMPLAKDIKKLFIKNYKSPYAVTEVFLNFYNSPLEKNK